MNDDLIDGRKAYLDQFYVGSDPLSCIHTIDINVTDLCNRTCEFCPRSTTYPNVDVHMSVATAKTLGAQLADMYYDNQIHFGGHGEPLLAHRFLSIVEAIKEHLPDNHNFHLTTNGDRLTGSQIQALIDVGIDHINVSCYDGAEDAARTDELLSGYKVSYTIKHFYHSKTVNWGLPAISNRAGTLYPGTLNSKCYLPFYSASVDWNGNVHLCVHDWNKRKIFGNIHYTSLKDIWLGDDMNAYRKMLLNNKRDCAPCSGCDVRGDYYGDRNFDFFKELL